MSSSPTADARKQLLLVSILALFCELLIIRWLSTEVRIFAYFKNLPLMAAFLGLGLGFLWTKKKTDFFHWSPILLIYFCGMLIAANTIGITFLSFVDPFEFYLFGLRYDVADQHTTSLLLTLRNLAIMLAIFAFTASPFVGMGQRMGQLFSRLKPLEAYSINIAGGLIGTAFFTLISWMGAGPGVWVVCAGIFFLLLKRFPIGTAIVLLGLVYQFWAGPYMAQKYWGPDYVRTVWSPYYRIDVIQERVPEGMPCAGKKFGYNIEINYDTFQDMLDCTPECLAQFPKSVQDSMLVAFSRPYRLTSKPPQSVLILGSGSGSDVAAAVRCGVKHIDAVEIDPSIVALGTELHHERPYQSPNVTHHVMDARTFLQTAKGKYDLILFAALDSHAALSSLSSLRLDNYVFTQEALNEASHMLTDKGIIVLNFVWMKDWLWDRDGKALAAATGMKPLGYDNMFGTKYGQVHAGLLLAGPGVAGKTAKDFHIDRPEKEVNLNSTVDVATDDFPFLFMPRRELPLLYMLPVLASLLLGMLVLARQLAAGAHVPLNWQMFGLGAAFMLLEVRAMAELSLVFGSTWTVNAVVISGIMAIILAGNYVAWRLKRSALPVIWAILLLSLSLSTFVSAADLARLGTVGGEVITTIVFLFPVLFASITFALLFKDAEDSSTALAFNLVGGLCGICLEYLSMWLGIRALGWIAVAVYACVLALYITFSQKPSAVVTASSPD